MTPEFAYFLKVNVAFILLYAFYRLFFYKDTFFKLRRTILLAFFGVSLLYPLMNIQDWIRISGMVQIRVGCPVSMSAFIQVREHI